MKRFDNDKLFLWVDEHHDNKRAKHTGVFDARISICLRNSTDVFDWIKELKIDYRADGIINITIVQ